MLPKTMNYVGVQRVRRTKVLMKILNWCERFERVMQKKLKNSLEGFSQLLFFKRQIGSFMICYLQVTGTIIYIFITDENI